MTMELTINPNNIPDILIVDDMRTDRMLLSSILKKMTANIFEAENAKDAFDLIQQSDFSAILMDINMPRVNGIEATRYIRNELGLKHLPILIITGMTDEEMVVSAFEAGATDYIKKPYMSCEILVRVKNAIERKNYEEALIMSNQAINNQKQQIQQAHDALNNIHQSLKQEYELNKAHSQNLVQQLSKLVLSKADLAQVNAKMIKKVMELNAENNRLHQFVSQHLSELESAGDKIDQWNS